MLLDSTKLARALGVSPWWVYALKRSAEGHGDSPFLAGGRYSTTARVLAWLEKHPTFVADRVHRPNGKVRPFVHRCAA